MKNIILVISSIIISFSITLIAYEIFENIKYQKWRSHFNATGKFGRFTIPSSNRILMWEYKPYGKYKKMKINRYGFRGDDYEWMDKPDKTYRVGFIGDSVTLGMGAKFDEIFTRVIEIEANSSDISLEFQSFNFAIDGYNAVQISEMLATKVLNFPLDKVFYVMCLNDFDFQEASGDKIRYFKKPNSFFLEKINKLRKLLSTSDYHLYHFNKNKDVVFQEILKMKKLLMGKGVFFQVVIMPNFMIDATEFMDYPLLEMHKEIKKFLLESGIGVIDLLDYFGKQRKPPKHFAKSIWHLNENGHQYVARALLSSLLNEVIQMQKPLLRADQTDRR